MDRVIRIGGGWYAAMDKRRGRPYYFNKNSGEKRWNFPKGGMNFGKELFFFAHGGCVCSERAAE
eukprot:1367620-Amorphochlora_amoeboformis.AAC.1